MLKSLSPTYDPWESYIDIEQTGSLQLSNIEFTTTNLCNMRCGHCAVGYTLQTKDPAPLPLDLLILRLEEIPGLRAMSITGGEPMLSLTAVKDYVVPLLKYAHDRGVKTQINSNLTLPAARYDLIVPYLDVLHISHNWGTIEEFTDYGFAVMDKKPPLPKRQAYFDRMIDNAKQLARQGVFVSAETMLNRRTVPYLDKIHEQINEMGCSRHEIHPTYPSDFASRLDVLNPDEMRLAIHHLLDIRDQNLWMLFGTLPFYACNQNEADIALLERLAQEKNVTVRNDPDGRSRLNVNIFDGEIIVTDFGDEPALGNVQMTSLPDAFARWTDSRLAKQLNCHCPSVKCLGPNVLVKNTYYPDVDFRKRGV